MGASKGLHCTACRLSVLGCNAITWANHLSWPQFSRIASLLMMLPHLHSLKDISTAREQRAEAVAAAGAAPLRHCLLESVMPCLAAGLSDIARLRPANPVQALVEHCRAAGKLAAAARAPDPYDAPIYGIQLAKAGAKAAREAARAAGGQVAGSG